MNSITKIQSDSSRVTVQGKLMLTSFQVMYEDHSSSILRHREIFICLQSQHCFRTPCKVSECCNSPFLTSCSSFEYSLNLQSWSIRFYRNKVHKLVNLFILVQIVLHSVPKKISYFCLFQYAKWEIFWDTVQSCVFAANMYYKLSCFFN